MRIAPPLGPYRADAILGTGGHATVYRVRHRDRSGPTRALKVLTADEPGLAARLAREGEVQRALRHPHVVAVHEQVALPGGPALLMDYVAGPSLRDVLGLRLPMQVVHDLGAQVLSGVAAAHRSGVVHRDLKPGNVLLEPRPTGYLARIADFGLARTRVDDGVLTATGALAGTLPYMAPEQLRDGVVDARTDVFALGALLYELVTGQPCFRGDPVELVVAISEGRFTPVTALSPSTPASLVGAIEAALRVDPGQRPADAGELLAKWGARPGPWPVALRRQIAARFTPEPLHAVTNRQLPRLEGALVGRATELAAITASLGTGRLVTLRGPGGVGKTRLAVEVCRGAEGFEDVVFCDLVSARSARDVAVRVARALDVPIPDAPERRVAEHLATRHGLLLLLDNVEQVAEHVATTVGAWRAGSAGLTVLATGRQRLGLPDETVFSVEALAHDAAVALFAACCRARVPDFAVDAANRAAVDEVVAMLDGLPLAIEIAAARVRDRSLTRLRAQLSERLQRLPHAHASSAHQRTLLETLSWSWDLLGLAERRALAQLAVFEGGCSRAAAEGVLVVPDGVDVGAVLDELVSRSLVQGGERLRLLVTIHTFAAERLAREPELEAEVQVRHADWFVQWGRRVREGASEMGLRAALGVELGNLVAASRRAARRGDGPRAVHTASLAWQVLSVRGPHRTGLDLLADAAALEGLPDADRSGLLRVVGEHLSSAEEGQPYLLRALELARHAGDRGREADTLNGLGILATRLRRPREARSYFADAIALCEASEHHETLAHALGNLGHLLAIEGDGDAAAALVDRSIALHEAHGRQGRAALGHVNQADRYVLAGRLDEAVRHLDRAEPIFREMDHTFGLAVTAATRARVLRTRGLHREAWPLLEAAVQQLAAFDGSRHHRLYQSDFGVTAWVLGHHDEAVRLLEPLLERVRAEGDPVDTATVEARLGAALVSAGEVERGAGHLDRAIGALRAAGDGRWPLWAVERARADALSGGDALRRLDEALVAATEPRIARIVLAHRAWVLLEHDRVGEARADLDQALAIDGHPGEGVGQLEALDAWAAVGEGRLDTARAALARAEAATVAAGMSSGARAVRLAEAVRARL